MPRPLWNPRQAFGIINWDPGYYRQTCVGYAPSQGRRCRNPIKQNNRDMIDQILYELSLTEPCEENMVQDLFVLAELCLCVRYHRTQVQAVVREWREILRSGAHGLNNPQPGLRPRPRARPAANLGISRLEYEGIVDVRRLLEPADRLSTVSSSSGPSSSGRSSDSSSTSGPSLGAWLDDLESHYSSPRHSSMFSSDETTNLTPSTSTSTRHSTPSTSSNLTTGRSTQSSSTLSSGTIQRNSVSPASSRATSRTSSVAAHERNSSRSGFASIASDSISPSSMHAGQSSPRTAPSRTRIVNRLSPRLIPEVQSCQTPHVVRRSTEVECPICYDSMMFTPRADLVWCKSTCGQNVHRECWDLWRNESMVNPTCTYWSVDPFVS